MLRAVLDQLQEKDQAKIFAQPVSVKEVRVSSGLTVTGSISIITQAVKCLDTLDWICFSHDFNTFYLKAYALMLEMSFADE